MFRLASRVLLIAVAAASLGACNASTNSLFAEGDKPAVAANTIESTTGPMGAGTEAMAADVPVRPRVVKRVVDPGLSPDTIVEVTAEPAPTTMALAPEKPFLPQDDVSLGKKYYAARDFGLAEKHFRAAAESHPRNPEAWLGLAAAYDQLRRFDLADRAYAQAIRLVGETVEMINNQGYSYILRGDYRRARERLLLAEVKAPDNPYVQANLRLLAERSGRPVAAR